MRARSVAVTVAGVLLLAACGTLPPPRTVGQRSVPDFTAKAGQVAAQWNRNRLAAVWRSSLILLDPGQLVQIPAGASFSSARQRGLFWSGHFALRSPLPARSPASLVRWADGTSMRVPTLSARSAFRALAPCGASPGCTVPGELTITSMRPAEASVPTSRGWALVPAWQFRAAQLNWPFIEIAVARRLQFALPARQQSPFDGTELGAVSADGRSLTLLAPVPCSREPGVHLYPQVYETASAVVVAVSVVTRWHSPLSTTCLAFRVAPVRVSLARPLGGRPVLDVHSGRPLLLSLEPSPVRA
jgi:hypothetical protein